MNDLVCWFLTIVAILTACSIAVGLVIEIRHAMWVHR